MPPLRRGANAGGLVDATTIGNNEAAAATNGLYLADDFIGQYALVATQSGSGGYGYGVPTPAGVPTLPAGWTWADLVGHPGILNQSTTALNDASAMNWSWNNNMNPINIASPSFTWDCIFSTPNALSNATERYIINIGPCVASTSGPLNGWALVYSDNVNSGCWYLQEYQSGSMAPVTIGNSGVSPTAKTWYRLRIIYKSGALSVYLNGTLIIQANSYLLNLGASYSVLICPFGMCKRRTASSASSTITMFVDRVALNMQGILRP